MQQLPVVIDKPQALRDHCDAIRRSGATVGFVPTMGALHAGHLSLVDRAVEETDHVVVSIFVNPTQFAPGEDFDRYPRTLNDDLRRLAPHSVHVVYAPSTEDMYPQEHSTTVSVAGLTHDLCGAQRPGHFDGVTTVVAKLFNTVGPCVAVFGRKDYQQFRVISAMVRDLNMPVQLIGAPTIREDDGLAMSSRNAYLSAADRQRALSISRGLSAAHRLFEQGERRVGHLREAVASRIQAAVDSVDYVTAADPTNLEQLSDTELAQSKMLIAVAVQVNNTRLIDNTVLGEDTAPAPNQKD